jgi:hypothetical protein
MKYNKQKLIKNPIIDNSLDLTRKQVQDSKIKYKINKQYKYNLTNKIKLVKSTIEKLNLELESNNKILNINEKILEKLNSIKLDEVLKRRARDVDIYNLSEKNLRIIYEIPEIEKIYKIKTILDLDYVIDILKKEVNDLKYKNKILRNSLQLNSSKLLTMQKKNEEQEQKVGGKLLNLKELNDIINNNNITREDLKKILN